MVPDLGEKLGGRGAWVSADPVSVERVTTKGYLSRAFKRPVTAPPDLCAIIDAGLERRALDALGLARRTGEAVAGFDQVKEALTGGKVAVLIAASEAGADGQAKLKRLGAGAPRVVGFACAKLSAALGKERVIHAALIAGAGATRFLREARRLEGFRPGLVEGWGEPAVEPLTTPA